MTAQTQTYMLPRMPFPRSNHPLHPASFEPLHPPSNSRNEPNLLAVTPFLNSLSIRSLSTSPAHRTAHQPAHDQRNSPPRPVLIPPPPLPTVPSHSSSIRVPSEAPTFPPRFPKRTEPPRRNSFPLNTKPLSLLSASKRTERRTEPRTATRWAHPAPSTISARPFSRSALHFRCRNRSATL